MQIAATCTELGVATEHIHVERFVSGLGGKLRPKPVVAPGGAACKAVAALIVDGKRKDANGGWRIHPRCGASARAWILPRRACRGRYVQHLLRQGRRGRHADGCQLFTGAVGTGGAGFVLTRQAHPVFERITVDYDQVWITCCRA